LVDVQDNDPLVDVSSITKRGKPRIRGLKGERRKTRLNRKVIRDSGQAYTTKKREENFPSENVANYQLQKKS
jgi:hypothetical protein